MKDRVAFLDGLRGLAALWVMVGHCLLLVNWRVPVLYSPDLGVDLFILLSGFLMVYTTTRSDWTQPSTAYVFWSKRFFRLSPLYFLLLIAALVAGHHLYEARSIIDTTFARPPQDPQRYTDPSFANFALHFTYLFGLIPAYAFRTPLPDWSLGLEMQFYIAFPFMMLVIRRFGWVLSIAFIALGGIVLAKLSYKLGLQYPMPSFLPLKLHMFLVGMLMAASISKDRVSKSVHFIGVLLLSIIPLGGSFDPLHVIVRTAITVGFFALLNWRNIRPVHLAANWMGSRPFHWLGELSYGVYLIHLLILQPVIAWLIIPYGSGLAPAAKFLIAFGLTAAVSYPLAWMGYSFVELGGQKLGKRVMARLFSSMRTPAVAATATS